MSTCTRISRKELYRRVWSEPVTRLAKEFGLSDVGFAKLCKRNDVPRPPRGYWAKKEAGQAVSPERLPRAETDWEIKITPHSMPIMDPEIRAEADRQLAQAAPETPIVVPETLRGAHPLVTESLRLLEFAEKDECGLLRPPSGRCLDVTVSKDSLRRALRLMDALIKALEQRGSQVKVLDEKDKKGTAVEIMGTRVPFGIRETLVDKREESEEDGDLTGRYTFRHSRFRSRTAPSGNLCLEIEPRRSYYAAGDGQRRKWSDGQRGRLEDHLAHFLAGVVKVAAAQREAELEAERRERERKEEERRRAEREAVRSAMWEKIKQERARVDKLTADAAAWAESQQIRAYISAVCQDAVARGQDVSDGSDLGTWVKWAGQQADRLDPLKESPPSILDDEEKYRQPERQRLW